MNAENISRRNFLLTSLGASALAACTSSNDESKDLVQEMESLWSYISNEPHVVSGEAIEKEINKWPSWISDFIYDLRIRKTHDNNLTVQYDGIRHILLVPYRDFTKMDVLVCLNNLDRDGKASFNSNSEEADKIINGFNRPDAPIKWDRLNLVQLNALKEEMVRYYESTPNYSSDVLGAIDLGLVHALVDSRHGLRHSPGYFGPSPKDFAENAIHILQSEEHRKELTDMFKSTYLGNAYDRVIEECGSIESLLRTDLSELDARFSSELGAFRGTPGGIHESTWDLASTTGEVSGLWSKSKLEKWRDTRYLFGPNEKDITFLELLGSIDFEQLSEHLVLKSDSGSTEKYYFKEHPAIILEKRNGNEFTLTYSGGIHKIEMFDIPKEEVHECWDYITKKTATELIIGHINARMISSLVSVYLGPTTCNKWELDEQQLKLLAGLQYKGENAFGSSIDKYMLAKGLKEEGMGWEIIQSELKYAASYTHNKRIYSWPTNGFRLKQPAKG
ncbi:MAG: hypothetical protein U9O94_00045 [Nanoarchaeota archaeon]|nr:hypothetical protein [Nanoarchaeota archaeon]